VCEDVCSARKCGTVTGQEADDMISISSIRATTTFINNCISLFLLSNVRGPQYGRRRQIESRLVYSLAVKGIAQWRTFLPTERRRRCRMPPPTPVASYTRRRRRAAAGRGRWARFRVSRKNFFPPKFQKNKQVPPQRTCYNIFRRRAVCSAKCR